MNRMTSAERERALERLMQTHGDSVLRVCCLMLKDRQLAEDAAQDTFVKAWNAIERLRNGDSEKPWLMRIAINTCKDVWKSGYSKMTDRKITIDTLPEIGAVDKYRDDTVICAVNDLPIMYREVVILHFYQDFSIADTAKILHIPQGTARTRLFRARAMLKERLKGWYFDEE